MVELDRNGKSGKGKGSSGLERFGERDEER